MSNEIPNYTKEQHELIADLCTTYGLTPDQIVFFDGDPEPVYDRKAQGKMVHALLPVAGVEDDPLPAPSIDTVAAKYKITFKDGTFTAGSGYVNLNETIDGRRITEGEARSSAVGRAARSALKNRGLNLLELHFQEKERRASGANVIKTDFTGSTPAETPKGTNEPPKSERSRLLASVHKLGYETGLINEINDSTEGKITDKTEWYKTLADRYGIDSCYGLDNEQLKDFASFLRSQQPARAA